MEQVIHVKHISCAHCEKAVMNALRSLPNVQSVTVQKHTSKLDMSLTNTTFVVTTIQQIPLKLVRATVDEAGYEMEE